MPDQPVQRSVTDLGALALLGSANLDLLSEALQTEAANWSVKVAPQVGTYGRANIDLRDPASELSRALQSDSAAAVVFERAEDLLGDLVHRPLELAKSEAVETLAAPMLDMIKAARRTFDGPVLVFSVAAFAPSTLGLADDGADMGLAPALARLNAHIRDQITALDGVHWIETTRLIAEVGLQAAAPGAFWHAARAPFSQIFAACLSRRLIGALLALRGRTTRLLVLDLDNTLWDGVVGEDGIGGLKLGDGYPGAAFREFQSRIKGLSDRGLVLTVASKNDEDLALKAMESHPDMVIRPGDLAIHRIGWGEKWHSIKSMLEKLSLGSANCMFLDDNPVERAKMRSHLPAVQVPDLPDTVADWPGILAPHPFLECLTLTKSDIGRAATYRVRAQIARAGCSRRPGCVLSFARSESHVRTLRDRQPAARRAIDRQNQPVQRHHPPA